MRTHAFVLKGVLFVVERARVGNHRARSRRGAILCSVSRSSSSCKHVSGEIVISVRFILHTRDGRVRDAQATRRRVQGHWQGT